MATIGIDKQTGEIIFEEYGRRITDPSEITYIKRHSDWKSKVYQLSVNLQNEIDANIERNRTIHIRVPKMITEQEINAKVAALHCGSYSIPPYSKASDTEIQNKAYAASLRYAECNAKRKKQIKELQNQKMQEFIDFYKAHDMDKETSYYAEENKVKMQKDAEYKTQYENAKNDLLKIIVDDEIVINKMLKNTLQSFSSDLPHFKANGIYKSGLTNTCSVNLYLPDLSCIEARKGNMLASGKISIKQRKEKDIVEDWTLCCNGLILYVAASVFNVNTSIEKVDISAEYAKTDKAFGSQSVLQFARCSFDRQSFSTINFFQIDPQSTIQNFSVVASQAVPSSSSKTSARKTKSTAQKKKPPFEINASDELTKNSLNIIFDGLKSLHDRYGNSFFAREEQPRLLSAIKDIFPKNEAEQEIIVLLATNDCFANLLNSATRESAEAKIREILTANNLPHIDDFVTDLESML